MPKYRYKCCPIRDCRSLLTVVERSTGKSYYECRWHGPMFLVTENDIMKTDNKLQEIKKNDNSL